MTINHTIRRRMSVYFKQAPVADNTREIIKSLLRIDGVDSADLTGKRLVVAYKFPDVTIGSVLSCIERVACRDAQQALNRFKNSAIAFMESNERDNLVHAGGWHRYIEDIYISHFDPGLNDRIDIRKQTWRKYQ